ncbi:Hypothetical protein PHPALM_10196 [Phytophthora palmivora]|uniref:Uncharacterized protein n=1 Tax=Phytophthora palmivora TaxID=4796 RepID=A0A2P4Y598_9STRA|nr:Hypothetical protein PHPALM_10196 [Phytophthora palmivora]
MMSRRDDESVDLQPLLEHSTAEDTSRDDYTVCGRREKKNPSWFMALGVGVAMLLIVHILFVALLRKTTVTLDKLTLPDLCHRRTVGEVVMEFQNPSYCSPVVGPLNITFSKKNTAFLHLQILKCCIVSYSLTEKILMCMEKFPF